MRIFAVTAIALVGLATVAACATGTDEDIDTGEGAVVAKNLSSNDFGLKDKEIALTLDDGPGPRTAELAEFLAREEVPVTFFMVGKNAKDNPRTLARVTELAAKSNGNIIIGNHSMTHTTPLPKQGTEGSINEIMNADAILASSITEAQKGLPSVRPFFRPPYGAFTSLGAANISRVNAAGADKYTGPVFWDIGGELTEKFSADWACWGQKLTIDRCTDGYVAETLAHRKGIILAHDVHSRTVDMLMGTNGANGRSLIKDLRKAGFKFVSLRAHEEAVQAFHDQQQRMATNTEITIDAQVVTSAENGRVVVDVKTTGAGRVVAQFDNGAANGIEFTGDKKLDVTLPPGSHFVTVSAFDGAGVMQGQKRFTFIIAAPIQPGSSEATNEGGALCVNADLMKAGQLYRLYHNKVPCGVALASGKMPFNPPFIEECYEFKGVLKTTRDPKLVGPSEWSLDFDLSYQADKTDKSKVGFVMQASDGTVETGSRFDRGTNRPDVPMVFDNVDCAHGEWRGQFHYKTGKTEDFLFRMVRNPQTGGKIDFRE